MVLTARPVGSLCWFGSVPAPPGAPSCGGSSGPSQASSWFHLAGVRRSETVPEHLDRQLALRPGARAQVSDRQVCALREGRGGRVSPTPRRWGACKSRETRFCPGRSGASPALTARTLYEDDPQQALRPLTPTPTSIRSHFSNMPISFKSKPAKQKKLLIKIYKSTFTGCNNILGA